MSNDKGEERAGCLLSVLLALGALAGVWFTAWGLTWFDRPPFSIAWLVTCVSGIVGLIGTSLIVGWATLDEMSKKPKDRDE